VCFDNLGRLPDELADAACRLATGVRPDFLDRAVIVEFFDIAADMRGDEAEFWRGFEQARPRILGSLLDVFVAGLKKVPQVRLEQLPTIADFALSVSECEEGLVMKAGEALVPTTQPSGDPQPGSGVLFNIRTGHLIGSGGS